MVGNAAWNAARREETEAQFPDIAPSGYELTSPDTIDYNCVAWAVAQDTDSWWWPDDSGESFWPSEVPREETVEAFVMAFQLYGYEKCDSADVEAGFQKIAIYANASQVPQHVALLNPQTGRWLSKIGPAEDIEHNTSKVFTADHQRMGK